MCLEKNAFCTLLTESAMGPKFQVRLAFKKDHGIFKATFKVVLKTPHGGTGVSKIAPLTSFFVR